MVFVENACDGSWLPRDPGVIKGHFVVEGTDGGFIATSSNIQPEETI